MNGLEVDLNISAHYALPVAHTQAEIFGRNLERLRTSRHLTQEQLADLLHKRQSTISNMESGKGGLPKAITLRELARVLKCSMEEFLAGLGESPAPRKTEKRGRPEPAAPAPREPFRANDRAQRRRSVK